MNKDDGISIPQSYSSYIAPLQSQKLYQEVRYHSWSPNRAEPESSFDVAFVVRVTNAHSIDRPKRLFHFQHPNRGLFSCFLFFFLQKNYVENEKNLIDFYKLKIQSFLHAET